jgi:hypothetical protein
MLFCENPKLIRWSPDFSLSEQPDPDWTKVVCHEVELCNSLEKCEWDSNPVQIHLCKTCGYAGCSQGGYVHISRIGYYLIWTESQIENEDEFDRMQYGSAWYLYKHGPLLLPTSVWDQWKQTVSSLPAFKVFAIVTGRSIADAWCLSMGGQLEVKDFNNLFHILKDKLIASDDYDLSTTQNYCNDIVSWLEQYWDKPLNGSLRNASELDVNVQTIYIDGARVEEWPAFYVLEDKPWPAFGKEWVYSPEKETEAEKKR